LLLQTVHPFGLLCTHSSQRIIHHETSKNIAILQLLNICPHPRLFLWTSYYKFTSIFTTSTRMPNMKFKLKMSKTTSLFFFYFTLTIVSFITVLLISSIQLLKSTFFSLVPFNPLGSPLASINSHHSNCSLWSKLKSSILLFLPPMV
jgi:hypothetical protein